MNKLKVLTFDLAQISTVCSDDGYGFWGLNLISQLDINDFMTNSFISDLANLDIIWIYGYDFQDNKSKKISEFIEFINANVKNCKSIIFDLQGEGHSSACYLEYFDDFRKNLNIKGYKSKILWNLNKKIFYKDYDIFYYDYYELVYWYKVKNLKPLEFKNKYDRKYVFSFLNGTLNGRPHRYKMLKKILLNANLVNISLISNLDKSTDISYIQPIPYNNKENFFSSSEYCTRDSYINLISESVFDSYDNAFFITEKSIKPFVLQQIPIFLGPTNIANHFKKYGFDLFEDIINHSYDEEENLDLKIDLIYKELNKIQKLNFSNIFKQIENRLQYNYNLYLNMIDNIDIIENKLKEWILKI
jgi:hypothetical protein